ncbi:hypothetical protein [Streptomyces varsoviensis]|uniref:hypothetical protein n=1 Tax=Streptomyces varsoviensis TaxID=67373 RepID=UPI00068FC538|nr:hypothetical protein [Streptomyces varsoviensis]
MTVRRSVLRLGGLVLGAWALSCPSASASAGGPSEYGPGRGDRVPATELGSDAACEVPPVHDADVIRIVHRVGGDLGVGDKVMLAGFEAGWVESHMNNLACGDRDSLGVFQQRPSQGWGTPEQCMDVAYAANAFFTRAVAADCGHPDWTAGQVAQEVQRSAFPARYDEAEPKARALLAEAAEAGDGPKG